MYVYVVCKKDFNNLKKKINNRKRKEIKLYIGLIWGWM